MNLFELAATLKLNTSEYERGIKSAKASAAVFAREMTKNQVDVSGFSSKLSAVGKTLQRVGSGITQFGNKVTSVGRAASVVTAGVGAVLGGAFVKAKDYIGTYESAMATFRHSAQIGEEGAQALYDSLLKVAKNSAYAREHFLSAGQSLVAMGLSADDTTKYIQAITDTVAKMGGSGQDIEEMADLFGKLSLQTNLYTQDVNQMVTAGIPAWDILATHYHTTTDEVKKMAKQGLLPAKESLDIVTDALEETNTASEMFKFSAAGMAKELKEGTLTGTLDALNTSFRDFALKLLDLDPATESGKENIKTLNKAISDFGGVLETVGKKFGFIGDWIKAGLSNASEFLEKLKEKLENTPQEKLESIARIVGIIAAAGPVLIVVGKTISFVGSTISGIGSICEALEPVVSGLGGVFNSFAAAVGGVGAALGIIGAVVGVVVLAFIFLREHWDKVVQAWDEWMEKSGFREALENIKQKFSEIGEKLSGLHDFFQVLGAICAAIVVPIFAALMAVFNGLMGAFEGFLTMFGGVIDFLSGIGELIMGIFTLDEQKIKNGLTKIVLGVCEIFAGFEEAIEKFLGGILNGILGWFGTTWNELWSWLSNVGGEIWNWFGSIFSGIGEWFGNLIGNVAGWLGNIWNNITGWFGDLGGRLLVWLADIGIWVWEKVEQGKAILLGFWNKITEIFDNIKNTIWEKIDWAKNKVGEIFDNIKNFIGDKLGQARDKVWEILDSIKNFFSEKFGQAKDAVFGVFDNIKNGIKEKLDAAKDIVSGIIDKIKGFFSFQFEWPNIPLPHFKVEPDGWQIGDLLKGSIPWLNIDWYAKGGIFTRPTLFPTTNGFNGVGEAGAEAVLPIELLRGYIVDAMAEGVREAQIAYKDSASGMSNAGMVNALMSAIRDNQQEINVYIGGKRIANEIYDPLMDIMKSKEVYVGA